MGDTGIARKSVARGLQLESRFCRADPPLLRCVPGYDRSRRARPSLKIRSQQAGFKNPAKKSGFKNWIEKT